MLNTILGTKVKMSQTFTKNVRTPVTIIKTGPCVVTSIKSQDKDGYWAVQLGFGDKKIKNITKPLRGHLKGAIKDNIAPAFLREVKVSGKPELKIGDIVNLNDVVAKGDAVSITGTSKGKGFAGVVKRWGFAGSPRTHGQKSRRRAPGSIGQGTTPGLVRKGKKMGGRMGNETIKVTNLKVISTNLEKGTIKVKGTVPGSFGGFLIVEKTKEAPKKEKRSVVSKEEVQNDQA
jgi:large subunit ribosomal protein L3